MTTHLHNGHTPSESDGNPVNYFNSINDPERRSTRTASRISIIRTCSPASPIRQYRPGRQPERGAGLAVVPRPPPRFHRPERLQGHVRLLQPVRRVWTRGDGTGLRLPHGEFDIPIFFHDALFDQNCQTVFDLFNLDGILGDRFLANGVDPALPERQEAPLSVPALRARPVALVGMVAVGRHQLPAVLADLPPTATCCRTPCR